MRTFFIDAKMLNIYQIPISALTPLKLTENSVKSD